MKSSMPHARRASKKPSSSFIRRDRLLSLLFEGQRKAAALTMLLEGSAERGTVRAAVLDVEALAPLVDDLARLFRRAERLAG